jgi:hypothetical protein
MPEHVRREETDEAAATDDLPELTPEEAAEVSSEPIDLPGGERRIVQQNVGRNQEAGSGEWPDRDTPPVDPAPGAAADEP